MRNPNIVTVYFIMYYDNGVLKNVQTNVKATYESYSSVPLDTRTDLVVVGRHKGMLLNANTHDDYKAKPTVIENVLIVDRGIMDIRKDL